MIYFIEIWSTKQAWRDLSIQERGEYMGQVGQHIQGLLDNGVKILTWSDNIASTSNRADYEFFAAWTFPNQDSADSFQNLIEGAGWYNYFEQKNLSGKEDSVDNIINKMINI